MLDTHAEADLIGKRQSTVWRARKHADHPIHGPHGDVIHHGKTAVALAPRDEVLAWWAARRPTAPPRAEWPHKQWRAVLAIAAGHPDDVTATMRGILTARGALTDDGGLAPETRALVDQYQPAATATT